MTSPQESLPGPLRIAVLGDMDGPHTRRWLKVFIERGHDIHAISFYQPRTALPGATLHVLSGAVTAQDQPQPASAAGWRRARHLLQRRAPSAMRLLQAMRYRRAGLQGLLERIQPDVFHAHFVVDHGFYGAFAGFHPYVVSAWGSDILRVPSTLAGRWIASRALRAADLVTAHDPELAARAARLGVEPERLAVVRLGIDDLFFDAAGRSLNETAAVAEPPTILSNRALEALYNVDHVLRAFAMLHERLPTARLVVANDGSQREALQALARKLGLGESVRFVGRLSGEEMRDALAAAHVYVSVPASDAFSLSTMEAMAVGAFPIVSDLPSQAWILHRVNGLRVPVGAVEKLADSLHLALTDHDLRRAAVEPNRKQVWSEGRLLPNMLLMERHYYRLAGRPLADKGGL